VRLDEPRAALLLGRLAHLLDAFPGELAKAVTASINAVAGRTRNRAIKILAARYAAEPGSFRDKIGVARARGDGGAATVYGHGRGISLSKWPNRPVPVVKDSGRVYMGVAVQVLRAGGHKTVKGGFLARGRNGGSLIYRRKGGPRLPVEALYGPSIVGWFKDPENLKELSDFAGEQLGPVVRAVAMRRLRKLGLAI
ncbi:MAG: phage tail protein, partial [Deltaproteobacteria bacterium]|nr:phage tail protein [Deltaproteobacteria bacterium]